LASALVDDGLPSTAKEPAAAKATSEAKAAVSKVELDPSFPRRTCCNPTLVPDNDEDSKLLELPVAASKGTLIEGLKAPPLAGRDEDQCEARYLDLAEA
jgi:hypothetical protein